MSRSASGSERMGVKPIGWLLLSISLPIMLSMLVQALYNVVDSIYISELNETALSAVSLAFPMQSLMIAIGTGTATGMNALLSRSLGERNHTKANMVARNGAFLFAATYLLFLLVGFCFTRSFFAVQTDDPLLIQYGEDYLFVCLVGSFSLFGQFLFERLLQSTGRAALSMISQIAGAVTNIILDPLMIFGYKGIPAMGVQGAAIATIIGQFIGCLVGLFLHLWKNKEIKLSFRAFRLDWNIIRTIYAIGLPAIIMQSIASFMTFAMNSILIGFNSTATAVYGIYFRLQSFVFMPVYGLTTGMVPIISYNYGAGNRARIQRTIRLGMISAVSVMAAGTLVFQVIPRRLLSLFNASDDMMAIGIPALRIISICFVFAGICIVASTVFQSLGRGILSLAISVIRQLVILLPTAYLLSLTGTLNFIWLAFPISEAVSVAISILVLRHINNKVISVLTPSENLNPSQALEDPQSLSDVV